VPYQSVVLVGHEEKSSHEFEQNSKDKGNKILTGNIFKLHQFACIVCIGGHYAACACAWQLYDRLPFNDLLTFNPFVLTP
jgi:hypothetical protein